MTRVSLSDYRELTDGEAITSTKLHDEERWARKDYVCRACHKPISKGSRYRSCAYIVDGDFEYTRYHLDYMGECITHE